MLTLLCKTYRSTCDYKFNLSLRSADKFGVLLAHRAQDVQSVHVRQSGKEVLDDVAFVTRDLLLQLLDDLALVIGGQCGRGKDRVELVVLLEDVVEVLEASGCVVEGLSLRTGGPLHVLSAT